MRNSRIPAVHASASVKPKSTVQHSSSAGHALPGRDHVSIFVRSLHLLDLNQRDDWPEVTELMFAARTAQQHLQHRVKAVEWSLYRLFQLYDADETRDKLDPFFPPVSPLQSVNLRAALYRCLTELKKNGVLGAQIQLRKTMLDECKGDKFHEVIASFAMVVLRKVIKLQYPDKNVPAGQLLPLALAYRHKLQKDLNKRKTLKLQHEEFISRIQEVKAELNDRQREVEAQYQQFNPSQASILMSLVNSNWIGDRKWADLIINGPPVKDIIQDFGLSQGVADVSTNSDVDPIRDLDNQIQLHQNRLLEWKVIAKDLKSSRDLNRSAPDQLSTTSLSSGRQRQEKRFTKHKHLQVNGKELTSHRSLDITPVYQELLDSMQRELTDGSTGLSSALPRPSQTVVPVDDALSDLARKAQPAVISPTASLPGILNSEHHIDSTPQPVDHQDLRYDFVRDTVDENTKLIEDTQPLTQQFNKLTVEDSPRPNSSPVSSIPDESTNSSWIAEPGSSAITARFTSPAKPLRAATPEVDSDEDDPEPAASPSKEWMSLVDRTRASMTGFSHYKQPLDTLLDDEYHRPHTNDKRLTHIPESESSFSTPRPEHKRAVQPDSELDAEEEDPEARRATLLERTRQSMSLLASTTRFPNTIPNQNNTSTTTTHRSKRKSHLPPSSSTKRLSLFPVNQFETPGKPRNRRTSEFGPGSGSSTPREKLFEEEADYASVFKSRPKLAMSPRMGAIGGGDGYGDGDEDEAEDGVGFDSILEQDMEGLELVGSDEEGDEVDDMQDTPRAVRSGYGPGYGHR